MYLAKKKKKKKVAISPHTKQRKQSHPKGKNLDKMFFCFLFFFDKMFLIKMIKPIFKKFSESCLIYNE